MMGLVRSSLIISSSVSEEDLLASSAPPVTPYTGLSKFITGLPVTGKGSELVCLEVGIILALSSSLSSSLHKQEEKYSANSISAKISYDKLQVAAVAIALRQAL